MNIRNRYLWVQAWAVLLTASACADLALEGIALSAAPTDQPVTLRFRKLEPRSDSVLRIECLLDIQKGVHVYAAESLFFELKPTTRVGLGAPALKLPETVTYRNFDGTTVQVFKDSAGLVLSMPITSPSWHVQGHLRYQACDATKCFLPRKESFRFSAKGFSPTAADLGDTGRTTEGAAGWENLKDDFDVAGRLAGYIPAERFAGFLENPESEGTKGGFAGKSIWVVILLALAGGMALNLTPCILPMIPITLAVIGAGSQSGSRARGFLVGAAYGAGMALAYGVVGGAVVLTGTRFGTLNASPVFNLVIALVFALLALAMFDVIHIDFTKYRSGSAAGRRSGIAAACITGIVAALLAGACVAPVVISVVLYASSLYGQGNLAGLFLPLMLGLGMAVPWPFAGAGFSFLPKPGAWMVWVRNVFGVVILGIAGYYGYTAASSWMSVPEVGEELIVDVSEAGGPESFSLREGLRTARDEGKPVLIDFWATWCKNCLAMEATTFRDPAVKKQLESYVFVKFKAENPDAPSTRAILDEFGVLGLPTYVILTPLKQN